MQPFLGTWAGTGQAFYPTIDATTYREQLTFSAHVGDAYVMTEQKTWRMLDDGTETLLHWEFGFIHKRDDGGYTWTNTQNNGRAEVLKGHLVKTGGVWVLSMAATTFANDARMLSATRRYELHGAELRYSMSMALQHHQAQTAHLQARLTRRRD